MKKVLLLALVLVMALCASAYAKDVVIAFSQIGQESDWRTANTDDLRHAIEGHEGWKLVYDDGQQKQENQIKALRNFITQNVDYILFTGVVSTGWDEVLKEVNEAEIPLLLIDRIPDCADKIDYVAAFGGDFVEEGRRQVAWAGEYLKSIGKGDTDVNVVIMEGTTGASAQTGRTEGNLKALKEYPHLKLVGQQSGNFTRAEGQAVMESWLKSIDKIDVLIAQNDDMALGAIDAIKAAGKVPGKDIIIVGCDSVKAAFDSIVAGEMNCTVECTPLYGKFVVPTIEALIKGEKFSKTVVHPEEGVFDMNGGIDLGTVKSIKAADVIATRQY
ncbi:MAG: ABC transporter substrate-binding protein [Synergistaceae bacterium]|nr:ABC transporter substrate-binding protein [Synergistaceae bacterium]MBQ6738812.1 ABC transporter substrate-binding protein [Synergistaceae bacterium]MBQ7068077.1 ABC transporter substrate-binding protein [Synergistaceae bacterium]MBR0074235.1 ABC transporter substrate-binding protein [Synergistaceae bacterium]MBR0080418.1 ABC transporter substrate-binding protein [Synergistaceae bacterium]